MAAAHRPVVLAGIAEAQGRAVGVGFRTLAAELVEAVALAVAAVAEFHGEAPGVEVGAALAVFMDQARVGKLGTAQLVEFRQLAEGEEMHHGGEEVVGVGRAAGNGHHRLAEDFGHTRGAGRAGIGAGNRGNGRGHAAPGGAGADGDHGRGIGRAFLEHVDRGLAADLAVDAVGLGRDRAFNHQHVLALVGLHRRLARGLGLVPGGGHQGLVVVERDDVEDQLFQRRVFGAQQRLGAARAFLEVQPDHGGPLGGFDRLGHRGFGAGRQAQGGRQRGAELQEFAARHLQALLDFLQCAATGVEKFVDVAHVCCPPGCQAGIDLIENSQRKYCANNDLARSDLKFQSLAKI
jgi:hypothetical protein